MAGSTFDKLAEDISKVAKDLLTIEINTIIKSDMSAAKMPHSNRLILFEIAKNYDAKLKDFKTYDSELKESNAREPVYWDFSGMRSFEELQERADFELGKLQKLSQDKQRENEKKIRMLERIGSNSSNIVGMFKALEQKIKNDKNRVKKYEEIPKGPGIEKLMKMKNLNKPEKHLGSRFWNNDIDRGTMNEIDDLDLDKDSIIMIGKTWDIGTEQIMLQTVIELGGDVTTRISNVLFEKYQGDIRDKIIGIHNDSITTSVGMWSTIVKTLSEFAGSIFNVPGKK